MTTDLDRIKTVSQLNDHHNCAVAMGAGPTGCQQPKERPKTMHVEARNSEGGHPRPGAMHGATTSCSEASAIGDRESACCERWAGSAREHVLCSEPRTWLPAVGAVVGPCAGRGVPQVRFTLQISTNAPHTLTPHVSGSRLHADLVTQLRPRVIGGGWLWAGPRSTGGSAPSSCSKIPPHTPRPLRSSVVVSVCCCSRPHVCTLALLTSLSHLTRTQRADRNTRRDTGANTRQRHDARHRKSPLLNHGTGQGVKEGTPGSSRPRGALTQAMPICRLPLPRAAETRCTAAATLCTSSGAGPSDVRAASSSESVHAAAHTDAAAGAMDAAAEDGHGESEEDVVEVEGEAEDGQPSTWQWLSRLARWR